MNYKCSRGLHILNIGRLCLMWRLRRRPRSSIASPIKEVAKRYGVPYKPLPRANWKDDRAQRYGANAVAASLYVEEQPTIVQVRLPKARML